MSSFITVMISSLPTELTVPKSLLDAHEIEYKTIDELTIQVDNFLSNAMGGVKLQVKPQDVERARQLLSEAGFDINLESEPGWLSKKLANPKFYKRFQWSAGITIVIILLLAVYVIINR